MSKSSNSKKYERKEPEELFLEIYLQCKKLEIPLKDLSTLSNVERLKNPNFIFSKQFLLRSMGIFALGSVLIVLSGCKFIFWLLLKIWFIGYDVRSEMCVVPMSPSMQNAFMPPVDCSMCRNLTEVERVEKISPQEFEFRFAYSGVPVIVTDATRNWTAMQTFSVEFFRQLYLNAGGGDPYSRPKECQFFPYQTEFNGLNEVLTMDPEREKGPWYVGWSNCDGDIGNTLRKHYKRPYFLPLQAESTNIDWIFMGKPGYGAAMHIDHVTNPSWQAQIRGSKLWTLEPVPECYSECSTVQTLVKPGEVIVLDTNRWYHQTLTKGDEISITIGAEYD